MTDQKSRQKSRKTTWKLFDAINYRIFLIGSAVIILGYFTMMQGPHDSFLSLHLSPVLLVLGYCILIPIAILFRPKSKKGD